MLIKTLSAVEKVVGTVVEHYLHCWGFETKVKHNFCTNCHLASLRSLLTAYYLSVNCTAPDSK